MAEERTLDQHLVAAAEREGGKRLLWWLVGGGFAVAGPVLAVVIAAVAGMGLLAGIGHWFAGLFGPSPPMIATPTSRPTEWLTSATTDAELDQGIPNTLVMAVINQASDGQVYGDRYYCSNGQSAGEACSTAYKGTHTVGTGYGLMGLDGRDLSLPAGHSWHSASWNLHDGIGKLATYLRGQRYWQSALQGFHSTVQTPPTWHDTTHYPQVIEGLVGRYDSGPTLGTWALAAWSHKTGQFTDPQNQPEWVFVVGAAPTGAPFAHAWRSPTVTRMFNPKTGKTTTTTQTHMLSGHDLASPVLVVGTLKDGRTMPFALSTDNATVPVWSGGAVFGADVPLTGPKALTRITAYWPQNGLSDTVQWPEQAWGTISTVSRVVDTQTVAQWWPMITVASQHTGVPADWIASEMENESGGNANAGQNGLAGAFGLMQLEPGTARALSGWYPGARSNPQENLMLGAELLAELHAEFGSWRLASAAYYGGSGGVQADGVSPGMAWSAAGPRLDTVPFTSAGNSLTMEEYANDVEATSQAIAKEKP